MSTTPRALIRRLVGPLKPSECFVVADVTRTILYQRRGGFSPQMKSLITRYVDAGGVFCAVTGDSFDTIDEHLLRPLVYRGPQTFFVITGAGARIDAVDRNGATSLHWSPQINKPARCALLDAVEEVLRDEFAAGFAFSDDQKDQLTSSQGDRLDLAAGFGLPEPVYVEIRPEKGATLFLEGPSDYHGHKASLLRRFAEHAEVQAIAKTEGLHISRGGDFVDLIASTKYDALASFFQLEETAQWNLDERFVIALGDSPNDEGLFTYPYKTRRGVISIFVGEDRSFFGHLQRQHSTKGDLIHLEGECVAGTEYTLSQLCDVSV